MMNDEKFKDLARTRDWYVVKFIPDLEKVPGVYLIVFENKKRYVGSSRNLASRLKNHLNNLLSYSPRGAWYKVAKEENNFPTNYPFKEKDPRSKLDKSGHYLGNRVSKKELQEFLDKQKKYEESIYHYWDIQRKVKILYCPCKDFGEFEDQLLQAIEDKEMWYNSQFKGYNKHRQEVKPNELLQS